jgi:hypothetical protein
MRKSWWTLPLLAAFAVAAASGSGFAMPSLGGPTGIVTVPTAAVAPTGELQVALSYHSLEMYSTPSEDFTVWSLQALAGITDQAELWAAYSAVRNEQDSHIWGIGGKVQFANEPQDSAALAVGASYEKWADGMIYRAAESPTAPVWTGDIKLFKAYIVATKDLTPMTGEAWEWSSGAGTRILGSLGLMYMKADPDEGSSESATRPFLGLEFVGASGTTLGLEYRWKDNTVDQDAVFSAVLRHPFSEAMTAEVGTTNAGPGGFGLDDQDFFVRLGYTIPLEQTGW